MPAVYPPGAAGFSEHVDNPEGDGRALTAVYYVNSSWSKQDGAMLNAWTAGAKDAVSASGPALSAASMAAGCAAGHTMSARIGRELVTGVLGRGISPCMRCGEQVDLKRGYYRCHDCDESLCMDCFHLLAWTSGTPASGIVQSLPGPGDIVLTGPCVSITHVILVSSAMERSEEHREALKVPEGHELYACGTVETTPFYPMDCIVKGSLHRSQYFFQRDPQFGRVTLVGMRAWDSEEPPTAIAPLYTKFVFHPFGRTATVPLDEAIFQEAIRASEYPGAYSTATVIKAFVSNRGILRPANYPTEESRKALLARLKCRWARGHICSSVAVEVWQRYFELRSCKDAALGIDAADAAAVDILRWVPLKADKATPSRLVKALTMSSWHLRDDIFLIPSTPPAACPSPRAEALGSEALAEAGVGCSSSSSSSTSAGSSEESSDAASAEDEVASEGTERISTVRASGVVVATLLPKVCP